MLISHRWSCAWCSNHVLLHFHSLEWAVYTTIVWWGKLKASLVNCRRLMPATELGWDGLCRTFFFFFFFGALFMPPSPAHKLSSVCRWRVHNDCVMRWDHDCSAAYGQAVEWREGIDLGLHGWDHSSSGFRCNLGWAMPLLWQLKWRLYVINLEIGWNPTSALRFSVTLSSSFPTIQFHPFPLLNKQFNEITIMHNPFMGSTLFKSWVISQERNSLLYNYSCV